MGETARTVAAVDLGATSGRVMAGTVSGSPASPRVGLTQVARFANGPITIPTGPSGTELHWDFPTLYGHIRSGLIEAFRAHPVASIGVDSWAVDYALISAGAASLPFHYRDTRCEGGVAAVHGRVPFTELYARNGLQFLSFNTLYQLAAEDPERLAGADGLLLIPDLVNYFLTGARRTERTNASTTGLLNVTTGGWDHDLMATVGIPERLFSPLIHPGEVVANLSEGSTLDLGAPAGVPVLAVGSHDTASAIVAVPMDAERAAYISCGTWGLVGVETESPITSGAARDANFTNEGGVDGRIRFLHNVMGLWLLSESTTTWADQGHEISLPDLLAAAAAIPAERAGTWLFDANDPAFLAPGDMPARIQSWFADRGRCAPASPAEITRSIVESLALAFADAVHTAAALSGVEVATIHIVGGGSLNELLCQRTADRAGLPVVAGPVEATATGNVLVQARTHGWVGQSLEELRAVVAASFEPRRFTPRSR